MDVSFFDWELVLSLPLVFLTFCSDHTVVFNNSMWSCSGFTHTVMFNTFIWSCPGVLKLHDTPIPTNEL